MWYTRKRYDLILFGRRDRDVVYPRVTVIQKHNSLQPEALNICKKTHRPAAGVVDEDGGGVDDAGCGAVPHTTPPSHRCARPRRRVRIRPDARPPAHAAPWPLAIPAVTVIQKHG